MVGALAAAVLPSVIGAGIDLVGGMMGNSASAEQARKARHSTERMFANKRLIDVLDLKKAGLNPMIAAGMGGGGGAGSVPNLPAASQSNPMPNAGRIIADGAIKAATVQNLETSSAKNVAEAGKANAEIMLTNANTNHMIADTPPNEKIPIAQIYKFSKSLSESDNAFLQAGLTGAQRDNAREQIHLLIKEGNIMELERFAKELGLHKLYAEAKSWNSEYGQNIRPYLGDASSLISTAKDIALPLVAGKASSTFSRTLRSNAPRISPYIKD